MTQKPPIRLREVDDTDLDTFFEQQADPIAAERAAFPSRDRPTFLRHWNDAVMHGSVTKRTIVADGAVAGYVVCFAKDGRRLIGYWLGRSFWGRGIATDALTAFLPLVHHRPLHAFVAKTNAPSIRVLEKCGFVRVDSTEAESTELHYALQA